MIPPDFRRNTKAQQKIFKHMCNFAARQEWKSGKREVSVWLDVEVTKDQARLLNPTVLDTITGYILEDSTGKKAKLKLP